MKLSATHAFNCIVLRVKLGLTSYEDVPLALSDLFEIYLGLHFTVRDLLDIKHDLDP